MEEELKCPVCRRLFTNPVLLPCNHSVCLACAVSIQQPAQQLQNTTETHSESSEDGNTSNTSSSHHQLTEDSLQDVDKLSLLSETDSGVVCNSRPNSYVGTPSIGNLVFCIHGNAVVGICCPVCKRLIFLDEEGANSLPKNRVLEKIVDKYGENKQYVVQCQLCEGEKTNAATKMCEQCEVFYCDGCLENCHPSRGPLAKHQLVSPAEGKSLLRTKHKDIQTKCSEHKDENLSMFCVLCKTIVCYVCVQDGRHINHEVQAIGVMCKSQKTELSQLLQQLSEKARSGTEFIQRLKCMGEQVQPNSLSFESAVIAHCDDLVAAIRQKQAELLTRISEEKVHKQATFREQIQHCTQRLHSTTALIQFSIEVLKESDPAAFLQVSSSLLNRVTTAERVFHKEMEFEARVSSDFELSLDNQSVLQAIESMNFLQMKAPGAPRIVPEDCSAENNTVTIAWAPHHNSHVDGYVLELDDGQEGEFREVYCGKEPICTVEGLHFDSMYNARVKAFNHAGDSQYSQTVCLQTAEVAWFTLDPTTASPDVIFTNDNLSASSHSFDDRTILGSVGFSRGVHYWEYTIDRHDNNKDPAFGIARFDVSKDKMLGKDEKGWSMYIDNSRSWFMHDGNHSDRTDGGITQGSVVGVLLDLNQHNLSFYINGQPHGPIAFTGLKGTFYPAVTLNRNVQISLHTGLVPPVESDTEDD